MRDARDFAKATDPFVVQVGGAIRRMAISLTSKALWQLIGYKLPGKDPQTHQVEPFLGIGYHSRPPSSGKPEAIVVMVNDAGNPMVIAVRDEKTRAAVAGALLEDESMMFNSKAVVYAKADGTIECRSVGRVAVALALKSDVEAVDAKYANHIHLDSSGGGTSGPLETVIANAPNPAFPTSDPAHPFLDAGGTPTTHPFHEGAGLADAGIVGTTTLKAE